MFFFVSHVKSTDSCRSVKNSLHIRLYSLRTEYRDAPYPQSAYQRTFGKLNYQHVYRYSNYCKKNKNLPYGLWVQFGETTAEYIIIMRINKLNKVIDNILGDKCISVRCIINKPII